MSTRTTYCNHCCYCKTSEFQYCENPKTVRVGDDKPCGHCGYCKTGETMYCEYPSKVT